MPNDPVCGRIPLAPPVGSAPEVQQCYADAAKWLRDTCPGCGGDPSCEATVAALYDLWIMECNELGGPNSPDVLGHIRALRRRFSERRRERRPAVPPKGGAR